MGNRIYELGCIPKSWVLGPFAYGTPVWAPVSFVRDAKYGPLIRRWSTMVLYWLHHELPKMVNLTAMVDIHV